LEQYLIHTPPRSRPRRGSKTSHTSHRFRRVRRRARGCGVPAPSAGTRRGTTDFRHARRELRRHPTGSGANAFAPTAKSALSGCRAQIGGTYRRSFGAQLRTPFQRLLSDRLPESAPRQSPNRTTRLARTDWWSAAKHSRADCAPETVPRSRASRRVCLVSRLVSPGPTEGPIPKRRSVTSRFYGLCIIIRPVGKLLDAKQN